MAKFYSSNSINSRRPTAKRGGKCPNCWMVNTSTEKELGAWFEWEQVFKCPYCGREYTINIKDCEKV